MKKIKQNIVRFFNKAVNYLVTIIKQAVNYLLANRTFVEKILSVTSNLIDKLNFIGEKSATKILTIENQEKLENLGQFRGFKRSNKILRTVMFAFIAILLWSIFAKTDQVVRANGTVIPASKIQTVQSAFGGIIDDIKISLSDEVSVGDIIFEIDKAQRRTDYESYKNEVKSRERKLEIYEDLLASGSEAEITIINERIMLSEAKRSLLEYKKRYENSLVRAPVNGRVSRVLITTVGQVVQPGEYLAEIVPEGEDLIIEVMVELKDIAKVRVGLKAKIAFTAFDSAVFGMFDGEVETVAASTTFDEARNSVYYIARVKVTDEGLEEDQSLIIQSGMESMVSIIGNKRSVISYILNPIKKLNQKAFGE